MFFIGILIPYNDPRLLSSTAETALSPLTIGLTDAGILAAADLINALIVLSVISAGNGSLYVSSRTLLFMARNGKAPRFIGRTNARGVPWVALICSNLYSCIVFLVLSSSAGKIYSALITTSGGEPFESTTPPSILTLNSRNIYGLVCNRYRTHSISKRPRSSRPRSIDAALPSAMVPMGHIRLRCGEYLPRLLPGLHGLSRPVQPVGFCNSLYPDSGFRAVSRGIQVLEQDQVCQIGGDGYLDGKERILGL